MSPPLQPAGACPRSEPLPPTARAFVRGRAVSGFRAAFTLAEILIAITLIVLVGGLAITNFDNISAGLKKPPVDSVLREAVREARYQAVLNKRNLLLAYNADKAAFLITDYLTGNEVAELPITLEGEGKVEVTFDPILPLKDLTSSPDDSPAQYANVTLSQLMFHSSGASTPVKVELKINNHDSTMFLDAFSEGPQPKAPLTP